MQRPQTVTWTTHTEESTTLLEATRLQEALLYTALQYTYMCNIVTEFYLYSIVYIYLINSRLDGYIQCSSSFSYCKLYHHILPYTIISGHIAVVLIWIIALRLLQEQLHVKVNQWA